MCRCSVVGIQVVGSSEQTQRPQREEDLQRQEQQRLEDRVSLSK